MHSVCKRIHFSYGHRLLKHPGKCAHFHGHNGVAEIFCEAKELKANGMVVDFDDITKALKGWINATLDHRMILQKEDPLIAMLDKWKEPYFKTELDPTAEVIAKLIFDKARESKLPVVRVTLWETPHSSASYY